MAPYHSVQRNRISDPVLYAWTPSTNALWIGGALEQVLGYAPDEIPADRTAWVDLIHPEDRNAFEAEIARVLGAHGVFRLRYRAQKRDSTYTWLEDVGQFVREPSDGVPRMSGFITDVSQRLKDERELERQADFARFNPNPILELSASGAINFANDAAYDMMRALDEKVLTAVLPADTDRILEQCLAIQEPVLRVEIEVKGRMLSWSFFPIPERGIVHCYGGDISERKRLEEQVRHSQKMEALGLLSGGIAHDFNNLLTVIQGQVGLIESSRALNPALAPNLAGIKDAAARAASLTRQLLTISRKHPLQRKSIDLRKIVTDMTGLLKRVLGEDIAIAFELGNEPQWVCADQSMLEQIMLNLAVNARDAMPAGGRLTVGLEAVPDDARLPAAVGGCIRWRFADSGVGIPREILPYIFDPFFTTKGSGKGSGLGLATVYSIVQQHAGHISVDSVSGRGTRFEIVLPRAEPAKEQEQAPAKGSVRGGSECILVVEDEAIVRELIERTLKRAGYRVIVASDAPAALDLWKINRELVSLVITDVVMPGGMSGRTLADTLHGERAELKVIFMSGYSAEVAGQQPDLRMGVNFLAKPFDSDGLLRTVRTNLDGGGSRPPFRVIGGGKEIVEVASN